MGSSIFWIGFVAPAGSLVISIYLVWRAIRDERRFSREDERNRADRGDDLSPGAALNPDPDGWMEDLGGWEPESEGWTPDGIGWAPDADDGVGGAGTKPWAPGSEDWLSEPGDAPGAGEGGRADPETRDPDGDR